MTVKPQEENPREKMLSLAVNIFIALFIFIDVLYFHFMTIANLFAVACNCVKLCLSCELSLTNWIVKHRLGFSE